MKWEEREILEYRPNLDYDPRVRSVIQRIESQVDVKGLEAKDLPPEILESLYLPLCNVYDMGKALINRLENATRLVQKKTETLVTPSPYATYLAQKEDDVAAAMEYEDYHRVSIDGLPYLEVEKLLKEMTIQAKNQFLFCEGLFPAVMSSSVSRCEADEEHVLSLGAMAVKDKESERLEPLLAKEKIRNEAKDIIHDAFIYMNEAMDELEPLLSSTVEDFFYGDVEDILNAFAQYTDNGLDGILLLSRKKLENMEQESQSLEEQNERISMIHDVLMDDWNTLSKEKVLLSSALYDFERVGILDGDTFLVGVLEDQMEEVENIFNDYDALIEDFHKNNESQSDILERSIQHIGDKQLARHTYKLAEETRKRNQTPKVIINNHHLKKKGIFGQ